MSMLHYVRGAWMGDAEMKAALATLEDDAGAALGEPLPTEAVLAAAEALGRSLLGEDETARALQRVLVVEHHQTEAEAADTLKEMAAFLSRAELEKKLVRELGSKEPLAAVRSGFREAHFESWAPLGTLVHVAPTNAASVGALSVLEGLLVGNFNVLKIGGQDGTFAAHFLATLAAREPTGALARRVVAVRVSSKDQETMARLVAVADGIAAWGSEEAVAGIRKLAPPHARFVDWGPKISFAYLTRAAALNAEVVQKLAEEIVLVEQQACSSPQVAYVDLDPKAEKDALVAFAERLAAALLELSRTRPAPELDRAERAEITNVVQVTRLEQYLEDGLTHVIDGSRDGYRVLVDFRSALRASPLNRTIWIKGLPRAEIVRTLRPMRAYLQTVGLAAPAEDYPALAEAFVRAGALRVAEIGSMLGSYAGEPHDGVYALPRYARRISYQPGESMAGVSSLAQLAAPAAPGLAMAEKPVLTKAGFQAHEVAAEHSHLFFKSGGSSGEPKLSIFTYDDYHRHMALAARGLYAAGLDPRHDRCMNLFFAGGLYGGFVSFFTILEMMRAVQLPMAANMDMEDVAQVLVKQRVNVLLGMPSYILQLFHRNDELLARERVVKKIFYGGEHFNEAQQKHFRERYGVELIRSATYGSVDAGPLGYQCRSCEGVTHHLHSELHSLEILELEKDAPVGKGEVGRLVFTSRVREGQDLARYEIGDVGRWVPGRCASGIAAPRFELLGRTGDVFRIGSEFFNYRKMTKILADHCAYSGEVQLELFSESAREEIRVLVDREGLDLMAMRRALLDHYGELSTVVEDEGLLSLTVKVVLGEEMERTKGSGKLRAVVDRRLPGKGVLR